MIYYRNNNDSTMTKFNVEIDAEKLNEIKKYIEKDCSQYIYCIETTISDPSKLYLKDYRKFHVQREYVDDREIYKVDYYKKIVPYLVDIIDRLIIGDIYAIQEFENISLMDSNLIDFTKEKEKLLNRLAIHLSAFDKDNSNFNLNNESKMINNLQNAIELLNYNISLNRNAKPVYLYYELVKECIHYEKVKDISCNDFSKNSNGDILKLKKSFRSNK